MDEITLEDKKYISSKRAAEVTGYAKDYIGQLCREGKIEARQIGRNWYVLETSIMEHRFGKPEVKIVTPQEVAPEVSAVEEATPASVFMLPTPEPVKPIEPIQTWQATSYVPEVQEILPPVAPKPIEVIVPELEPATITRPEPAAPVSPTVLAEMQSAWQDWFKIKEDLLETPDVVDARALHTEDAETSVPVALIQAPIKPIEPVKDLKDDAAGQDGYESAEQVVFVHKNIPASEYIDRKIERHAQKTQVHAPTRLSSSMPSNQSREARVIRERRIIAKRSPSNALRALLVGIALVSVAIAVIGTGHFDTYLTQFDSRLGVIQFLGGESILNKT